MPLHVPRCQRRGSKTHFHRAAVSGAAAFLILSVIFVPLESVFAQTSTDPSSPGTTSPDTSVSRSPSQANAGNSSGSTQVGTAQTGAASGSAGTRGTANQNPQPKQPPAEAPQTQTAPNLQPPVYTAFNQNQVKVDQNTGGLNTSFPLDIPPGRNGVQPSLSLVYNSENAQLGSIFGEGWSVSIPYIARLNKSGVDNLYSTSTLNYFTSSLDGEIVSTTTVSSTGVAYVARTENGTFDQYTFSSSSDAWTMIDKNGTQYVFGSASDSQQSDPNNTAHVYKWMLKSMTDTNGNSVLYNYFKDSGQIYPSSTIYTNTSSTNGLFEVDFQRASSTDNTTSSATGFAVQSNYRIGEIDVRVNGTWVRKYILGYSPGDNGNTALLSSIAESGENASGTVVSLPSSTFSYVTAAAGWTPSSTWNPPASFVTSSSIEAGLEIANLTGDGLPGIISNSNAWVDTGNAWTSSSTWVSPVNFITGGGGDNGYRVVDVNNNGLDDIISCGTSYINTGSGWTPSSTWVSPVCFANNNTSTGAIVLDVNGDGLPDIIQGYSDASGTAHYAAWINTGNGWATSTVWTPPTPFVTSGGLDSGARIADVNGDGLPDILSGYTDASGTAHYGAWLNTGSGWATSTIWTPPLPFMSNGGWDNGVRFTSLDGNGLPDIISGYTDISGNPHYASYIDTGSGWATSTVWNPPVLFDTDGGYDGGTRIVDVEGSGLPDIIQGYTDYLGANHYLAWTNDNASRADLLDEITYSQGGSSAITYTAAARSGSASGITNYAPYPVYVVSSIATNDGSGNISTSTYQYSGGTYYYGSPIDHEFAGFGLVTQTDGAGNVTKTYYDTSNGSSTSIGQYNDNFWKIGKAYRVENYDNASNLYKVTVTKWDSASLGGNAAYAFPDQALEMDYDGLSTHEDSAEAYTWNEANGNQTQNILYGQVTGNNDGTFTDTGTDEYTTNTTYASSTTSNVTGKPSDEILLNQSSTKIQETQYYYDNLGLGNIGAGDLTTQDDWISGTTYATTTRSTYNTYGLVTQTLDPRNNTTTYSYDTYNLYPATTTNALGQATAYRYDYSTGKTTQTIDPNHLTFQTHYDGLGRPLETLQPDEVTTSTLDEAKAYTYTDTSNAVSVEESDYLNATTSVNIYSYYDGLDRLIQTRKSATDAGTYKVTDQKYNDIGLLAEESLPYFASGTAETAGTSTSALFTTYTYDPLERVLDTTNAVGTVSNAYDNWKTTITDANGNPKDEYYDAYGNLVQVGEHNGSSTYATYYTYDGLKDLLTLTDANSNIRNFVYDGLGRMVSSTDLHASSDGTYGTWNYTYDNDGNLITRVDPKNQTVDYTYDGLNRVLTEDYTGASSTAVTYVYDSCTNGISRLCSVSSTDAVSLTTRTYDPQGNVASETKTINGTNYTTSYAYDRQGNQLTVTNPDNSVVQYGYGAGGLVTSVQEEESGGSFSTVITTIDYSPMDKIATQTNANGVATVNTYDPTRLYRLISTVTTDDGSGFTPEAFQGGGGNGGSINPRGSRPPSGFGTTYSCSSTLQTYTVPVGVTQLVIAAYAAQGAGGGGLGGEVGGTLSVTSGTTYYVDVGCENGAGGGGAGGGSGQNGGGMTWFSASNVFTTSTVLLVAGGGGGAAGGEPGGEGGGYGGNTWVEWAAGGGGGAPSQTSGGYGGYSGGYGSCPGGGGWVGNGGAGGCGGWENGGPGGGGGGGYYGAGGGGGGGDGQPGGSGGGGLSFVGSSPSLTDTVNNFGVNSGDGYLTITPLGSLGVASPSQYLLDGVTPITEGNSTTQGGVILGATLNDSASTTLQLQAEIEPAGTSFVNIPNVTSTFVAAGSVATATFMWGYGSYHWQVRAADTENNTSSWQLFGPTATSTDFSLVVASTVVETSTNMVGSYTVPANVTKITVTAVGSAGSPAGGLYPAGGGNGGLAVGALSTSSFTPGVTTYYFDIGDTNGDNGGGINGGYDGGNGGGMTWFSSTSTFSTSTALLVGGGGGGGGGFIGDAPGGAGGNGGGPVGSSGGSNAAAGGTGGSQSSGGSGGSGAAYSAGGGGGGGGYYGGGGGGGVGNGGNGSLAQGGAGGFGSDNTNTGGGGGGGGSSYVSSLLTSTSTATTTNTGNGYISINETFQPASLSPLNQYYANSSTPLVERGSTGLATVGFGATLNATSGVTTTLQLQVEVEPAHTPFANIPNVTSSAFVAPGSFATTSFTGLVATYHWQARWMSATSSTSPWQLFGLMPNATDFTLASTVPESYTGSVASYTVPPNVISLSVTGYGAEGGSIGGSSVGGLGAEMGGTLPVSSSQTFYVSVGGQNGFGGGGTGGSAGPGGNTDGAMGGGMTWFSSTSTFSTSTVLLVAGGGGASGGDGASNGGAGGYGGYAGGSPGTGGGAGGSDGYGGTNGYPGTAGQGGNGTQSSAGYLADGGGGGGGSGYWGGGGGKGADTVQAPPGCAPASSGGDCGFYGGYNGTNWGGGGGGGGSSYASTALSNTTASSSANSGNGSMTIYQTINPVPTLASPSQYFANGTTTLNEGSSTNQATVVFGGALNSYVSPAVQLQVEVEPAGTSFTGTPNATSSFVSRGSVATTSFTAVDGSYHWQARTIDSLNDTSAWQMFGPSSTSTDFVLAMPTVSFAFPTNGTSTPNFPNWQMTASDVTSTTNYQLQIMWDDTTGDPVQSTTVNASGTTLAGGVSIPKATFSGDYTYDGTPVTMNATATLSSASTTVATSSMSFTELTTPVPLGCGSSQIQCISYTYDNNGNVTQVADNSATNAAITVNYTYDGLNRLLSASSTNAASGSNYLQTFTYDPVGNMLSGPEGTYSYSATGDTDPDAVTSITNGSSTTNFTYDNDGNLTNASSGFAYTWDYNNRLLTVSSSNSSSSYGYDYTGTRVKVANGSTTTYYPETTYSVNGTTRTKNIFADGILLTTVTNATTTAGGISFDASSTSATVGGMNAATTTITVGSGTNEALGICVSMNAGATSSVSVDGNSATLVAHKVQGAKAADLYYYLNAGSGTHTVSTTMSVTGNKVFGVISLFGVNQTTPVEASSTKGGTGTQASSSITTASSNDWAVDCTSAVATGTPFSGQTKTSQNNATNPFIGMSYKQIATAQATTTGWNFSTSTAWAYDNAAFKAVTTTIATTTVSDVANNLFKGANAVTAASGTFEEGVDYYPYGAIRTDNTTSSYAGQQRKFIDQQYDGNTALNYLNARYQDPNRGQFLSEDPVFLGNSNNQHLDDPQSLNAYSYSENNPIVNSDPSGRSVGDLILGFVIVGIEAHDLGQYGNDLITAYQMSQTPYAFSQAQLNHAKTQVGVDAALFASGENLTKSAAQGLDLLTTAMDTMDSTWGGSPNKNAKEVGDASPAPNQTQLSVGNQNNGGKIPSSYSSQPVQSVVYQSNQSSQSTMGVVYSQGPNYGQQSSEYQQFETYYTQLLAYYEQLLNQQSNSQNNNKQ